MKRVTVLLMFIILMSGCSMQTNSIYNYRAGFFAPVPDDYTDNGEMTQVCEYKGKMLAVDNINMKILEIDPTSYTVADYIKLAQISKADHSLNSIYNSNGTLYICTDSGIYKYDSGSFNEIYKGSINQACIVGGTLLIDQSVGMGSSLIAARGSKKAVLIDDISGYGSIQCHKNKILFNARNWDGDGVKSLDLADNSYHIINNYFGTFAVDKDFLYFTSNTQIIQYDIDTQAEKAISTTDSKADNVEAAKDGILILSKEHGTYEINLNDGNKKKEISKDGCAWACIIGEYIITQEVTIAGNGQKTFIRVYSISGDRMMEKPIV